MHLLYNSKSHLAYTHDYCECQVYGYLYFMITFFIPLILLGFAYWKILTVVRRKAKVAANRRQIMAASKEPDAGTSKEKAESVTNTRSTSDKSERDKGVNKQAMPDATTTQQAVGQNKGLSKAKMNVIRTMIYIFICFVICLLPSNTAMLYTRITVRPTS